MHKARHHPASPWWALLAAAALSSCDRLPPSPSPPPAPETIATLNGEPLTRALLDQMMATQEGTPNPYDSQALSGPASERVRSREQALDDLLTIELLAQKARERGLDKTASVQAESQLQAKTLLAQRVVSELIASIQVSEGELRVLYEAQVPAHQFQVSHVLLPERTAAEAAIQQLRQGQAFDELARRISTDAASRIRGGDLGWLMMDQMPPGFAAAARALKPGEHTIQPVHTDQGWHVIQLRALRPLAERPSFETAKVWLQPQLLHAKVQAQQQDWREQAQIHLSSAP